MYQGYTADDERQAAMWALMQKHAEERAIAKEAAENAEQTKQPNA